MSYTLYERAKHQVERMLSDRTKVEKKEADEVVTNEDGGSGSAIKATKWSSLKKKRGPSRPSKLPSSVPTPFTEHKHHH